MLKKRASIRSSSTRSRSRSIAFETTWISKHESSASWCGIARYSTDSRSDLLDSALQAPQAGFGDTDFYPTLIEKAAVLCVRIARNHPLPDGNKRLAWIALVVFLELIGQPFQVQGDDAVEMMIAVAAGHVDEPTLASWLEEMIGRSVNSIRSS